MKKTIFVVLLALVLPLSASAQVATPTVTNEQLQTLLNSLLAQVLALMQKLQEIQAKQASDSQTLGAMQSTVDSTVTILNSKPVVTPTPAPVVSFGTPFCDPNNNGESAIVPFTVNGSDWTYGLVSTTLNPSSKWQFSKSGYPSGLINTYSVTDNAGSISVKVELGKSWADTLNSVPIIKHTLTDTVVVGNVCQ